MINTASSVTLEAPPTSPPSCLLGGQRAQTLWEQEALLMGHVTKLVTPAAWVTPHPQFPFLNLPLSGPGPEGRGLGGRRPPQSSGGRGRVGRHS